MAQPVLETDRAGEPRKHVHEFHVRFGDIDSFGHVNNCRYMTYLEDARVSMFYTDPVRQGLPRLRGLVIARHEIDYARPLLFGPDPVRVETWVTHLRGASLRLAYEVRDDEHVYARAASTVVAYDVEEGRTRRFTDEEKAFLETYR